MFCDATFVLAKEGVPDLIFRRPTFQADEIDAHLRANHPRRLRRIIGDAELFSMAWSISPGLARMIEIRPIYPPDCPSTLVEIPDWLRVAS